MFDNCAPRIQQQAKSQNFRQELPPVGVRESMFKYVSNGYLVIT